jgi:hypothetical protein
MQGSAVGAAQPARAAARGKAARRVAGTGGAIRYADGSGIDSSMVVPLPGALSISIVPSTR